MQATSLRRADRQWRWPLGRDLCLRLLAIAILSGATLMFHASTARFDVAEADIVENLDWSRHGAGWSASRFECFPPSTFIYFHAEGTTNGHCSIVNYYG